MDFLLIFGDSGGPSRQLHMLEMGVCHQMLADAGYKVDSIFLPSPEARLDGLINPESESRLVVLFLDEHAGGWLGVPQRIRELLPHAPLALAGTYPTLDPDASIAAMGVDMLIIGESDLPLADLASQMMRGGDLGALRNVWIKSSDQIRRNPLRAPIQSLDTLPFAHRTLLDKHADEGASGHPQIILSASRGCPFECAFCYSPLLKRLNSGKGSYYRFRSPSNIASEVSHLLRQTPDAQVEFVDEIFPTERAWLEELSTRLAGLVKNGIAVTLPAERVDATTLDLLKKAGCTLIRLGLETGSDSFRRRIAQRNLSSDRLRQIVNEATRHQMAVEMHTLSGVPMESLQLLQETETAIGTFEKVSVRSHFYHPVPDSLLPSPTPHGEKGAQTDFTQPVFVGAELSGESLKAHRLRLHFMSLGRTLANLSASSGHYDFVKHLPEARLTVQDPGEVEVLSAVVDGQEIHSLKLQVGRECRFSRAPLEGEMLVLSLMPSPEALRTVKELKVPLAAEVVWASASGETPLFFRSFTDSESSRPPQWQSCTCLLPSTLPEQGYLVFRANYLTAAGQKKRTQGHILWGNPCLRTEGGLVPASVERLKSVEARISQLEREVVQARESAGLAEEKELAARRERDQKAQRISELHEEILRLEKAYAELRDHTPNREEGLGDRVRDLFRKK
ncbi:hypothetical protein CVU37_09060 [candidate division BRC1 bacterium HGW-BRC1-1]|jgi:radical SAM superfamily enzyme YgiQ (UPF0313 family)|nr:MAG: hypothetical protein CVU37_09060 [candidate division BRC1 bacterium HGW-BRC1-1]